MTRPAGRAVAILFGASFTHFGLDCIPPPLVALIGSIPASAGVVPIYLIYIVFPLVGKRCYHFTYRVTEHESSGNSARPLGPGMRGCHRAIPTQSPLVNFRLLCQNVALVSTGSGRASSGVRVPAGHFIVQIVRSGSWCHCGSRTNRVIAGVDVAKYVFQLYWVHVATGEEMNLHLDGQCSWGTSPITSRAWSPWKPAEAAALGPITAEIGSRDHQSGQVATRVGGSHSVPVDVRQRQFASLARIDMRLSPRTCDQRTR